MSLSRDKMPYCGSLSSKHRKKVRSVDIVEVVFYREGWLRPLRGVNAVAVGSMPAHALYFTVYEKTKGFLTGNTAGHANTLAYGVSGVLATLVHDAVMNPAEVSILSIFHV